LIQKLLMSEAGSRDAMLAESRLMSRAETAGGKPAFEDMQENSHNE
jgi:hypothetical protein